MANPVPKIDKDLQTIIPAYYLSKTEFEKNPVKLRQ
jgi:hypothetical protein